MSYSTSCYNCGSTLWEQDMLIYGNHYCTKSGERLDPTQVLVALWEDTTDE